MMQRRHLLGAIALAPLAAPSIARAQAARTVKMGSLRLIHSMTPHFYQRFAPAHSFHDAAFLSALRAGGPHD
jgi:NitT/TauT family transport system substrate-binding protein